MTVITIPLDEDPRDIPEPDDPELLYFKNRPDEFVSLNRHGARVLNRTRKMARKPTGIPYYGVQPEQVDRWCYATMAPDDPVPHEAWDREAFVKGGHVK